MNNYGKIEWNAIDLVRYDTSLPPAAPCKVTNMDAAVQINAGSVRVDPLLVPNLNKPAEATLTNINYQSPLIYKDSPNGLVPCTSCAILNIQNRKLTFTVENWD